MLDKFQKDVIEKVADANALQPKYEQPKTSRLKVAKCRPSRGCCADKKDKHNHNKPAESSDSRLVFDCVFRMVRGPKNVRVVKNHRKVCSQYFFRYILDIENITITNPQSLVIPG